MLYLLELLSEAEEVELRQHLSGCQCCCQDLVSIRKTLADLPRAAETLKPHPRVRERLLTLLSSR